MKVIVKDNQTIWDIAVQYAGSVEAVIDILEANGKLTTVLLIGEELVIPEVLVQNIANFFESRGLIVATTATPLGVDTWVPPAELDRNVNVFVNGQAFKIVQAPGILKLEVVDNNYDLVDLTIENGLLKIPALPCGGTPNPAIVNIFQSDSTLLHTFEVPSGDVENWKIADSEITVGGHSWGVKSEDDLVLELIDKNQNSVTTTKVGDKIVLDDFPAALPCEDWTRPCSWPPEPVLGDQEIQMLMLHDTDEPTIMVVNTHDSYPSNQLEWYLNDVYVEAITSPDYLISINPLTQSITHGGKKWSWLKFKVLKTTSSAYSKMRFWSATPSLVSGRNRTLPILEIIRSTRINQQPEFKKEFLIDSQLSGSNYFDLRRVEHLKVINVSNVFLANLASLKHVSKVNISGDLNLKNSRGTGYDIVGTWFIEGYLRNRHSESTGKHDVMFKSSNVIDLRECFRRNPQALRFEFTDLSNISNGATDFSGCFNLKTLILTKLGQNFTISECYSLTENSLLAMIVSIADRTNETTSSINMYGLVFYQSVADAAASKNWTLLNY